MCATTSYHSHTPRQVILTKSKSSSRQASSQSSDTPKTFTFDRVFDWNCSQSEVFNDTALPIIHSTLEGYNGTIFAYGQTGTGKTHTMEGKYEPADLRGIIPNTFHRVFQEIEDGAGADYMVRSVAFRSFVSSDVPLSLRAPAGVHLCVSVCVCVRVCVCACVSV